MKNVELAGLGMKELSANECLEVNGGGIWDLLFRDAVAHFDEIAKGLEKGWNYLGTAKLRK